MANDDTSASTFTLQGEPAGLGTLPMGCLDHKGYSMSNKDDFYKKFIVELVPNNVNDAKQNKNLLKPVKPIQPRFGARVFTAAFRWTINAPGATNVMYSTDPLGRGKLYRRDNVWVPENGFAFEEARAWAYHGQVRPRLIHFNLPTSPEKYLWIDLSWPIRNILLPISQVPYANEKPNCTYVQINFRQLTGDLAYDGWAENGNQKFRKWVGDNKRGLVFDESAATMRIDLDLLYKQLTLPRHMRRNDFNVLAPLQVHRWDAVPYDPTLPMNSSGNSETGTLVSNYPLTGGTHSRESTEGVAFDIFLSRISGVQVEFRPPPPNVMVNVLNTVVSAGLGLVPVIGPLLAIGSDLAFKVLEDPHGFEIKNLLTAEFGSDLAVAIIESALGYQGVKKSGQAKDERPPGTMPPPLYSDESPDDYKLNPDIQDPTEPDN